MINQPLVKYDGKHWVLEYISNDFAFIWRDGIQKKIPYKEIKRQIEIMSKEE